MSASRLSDASLLDRARNHAIRFLDSLENRSVAATASRDEILGFLDVPLADRGESPEHVLDVLAAAAERGAIGSAGPRFFGFVIGGSLPVALAADWMTGAWDQNAGIYAAAPIAAVAEEIAGRWLLELFDLPRTATFGFVTGCQMANFTGLAAARHAVLARAGWDVEADGLIGAPRLNVVVSAEAHITIESALRMLGLGIGGALRVPTDEQGRMRAGELRHLTEHLTGPTIICAQAGNVNTGAIDPLAEIAAIAREHDAWLHVDSAFGLWGRASETRRGQLEGIELADSWATDAHKWLNVPYDCGVAIVRDAQAHSRSMSVKAAYLVQTSGVERDAVDWGPEFSRRARGLTVYAALRTLGREGVRELIDRCCMLAQRMAGLLEKNSRVRILNDVTLNQVLVRFDDDDTRTREIVARVQIDGTCWLGGTTWQGKAAMRISFSNWATNETDVDRSAEAILRSID